MIPQDRAWKRATFLHDKFVELDFAIVERPSNSMPGIPYNTPVRIVAVNLTDSRIYAGYPYLAVTVLLPNGEQRTLSGEALCEGKDAEKKFQLHQAAYSFGK